MSDESLPAPEDRPSEAGDAPEAQPVQDTPAAPEATPAPPEAQPEPVATSNGAEAQVSVEIPAPDVAADVAKLQADMAGLQSRLEAEVAKNEHLSEQIVHLQNALASSGEPLVATLSETEPFSFSEAALAQLKVAVTEAVDAFYRSMQKPASQPFE